MPQIYKFYASNAQIMASFFPPESWMLNTNHLNYNLSGRKTAMGKSRRQDSRKLVWSPYDAEWVWYVWGTLKEGWSEPGSGDGVGVQPQDEDGDHQKLSQPVMKSRFSCWMWWEAAGRSLARGYYNLNYVIKTSPWLLENGLEELKNERK